MNRKNFIQQTYREAESTIKSLHLEVGKIEYVPDIGKDMILEVRMNGKILKPGDKIKKSSKIDLVLGDGKTGFEDLEDSTMVEEPEIVEESVIKEKPKNTQKAEKNEEDTKTTEKSEFE